MILGIVQARMGSTRLPGKVLKEVGGVPLIALVVNRSLDATLIDKVVIATTALEEDEAIHGADIFRWDGEPEDVLGRFYACASHFGADIIVRITSDDPLKDPKLIDQVVSHLLTEPGLEYCSNTIEPTFPWGLDIEAIRFSTLKWLHENITSDIYREHVTYYITEHPGEFKVKNIKYKEDLHDWRWSIDTQADLDWFNAFFKRSGFNPMTVGYEEAIRYVKAERKRSKVRARGVAS